MWPTVVLAAEAPTTGASDQLIVMVGGVAVAAIGAVATVLVALVNSRNKTNPSPPAPAGPGDHAVYERLAVLERRADDQDEANELQDRRLDQIEDVLDVENPRWRHLHTRRTKPTP